MTDLKTYRVTLSRWATVRQSATVTVRAENPAEAEELAWDANFEWETTKTIDSDDHDAEAREEA